MILGEFPGRCTQRAHSAHALRTQCNNLAWESFVGVVSKKHNMEVPAWHLGFDELRMSMSNRLRGNLCTARALHAHCALLLDYVPPEEPPSTPLGNALSIR